MTNDKKWLDRQAKVTLERLMPRLEVHFGDILATPGWEAYTDRVEKHFPQLFAALHELYGHQYDFFYHIESIFTTATQAWIDRSDELKALDASRAADLKWFQSQRMVGAMCYVDLFSGDLKNMLERIPYLTELGVTYLHLMPLFRTPEGDDDGGYAISSYREIDPMVGTMEDMNKLAYELRRHGISLCLDFVFNHTADDHDWAIRARQKDPQFQDYYRMYPDREMPDRFEKTINPVFPDEHPGCFTYRNGMRKWVWTTFHNYQWDLNYENPAVFNAMAGEMLFLANIGVEILRLDAVAFTWKKEGTSCENLPQAHTLIKAFNALTNIVAPAMLFKSEAIVHPDEVMKYIHADECQLSYNPQLMALLWSTLATRDVSLLRHSMERRFQIPDDCAWVNYVRCHDDIGWTFSDEDMEHLGLTPQGHRKFLNEFYTGQFEGTFARGMPFQLNPKTGDMRVSGTTASLCGLELGLTSENETEIELAIRRILLLYGVITTIGGVPIIYLGDELGMLNDYSFEEDAETVGDTRWVHRPAFDWEVAEHRQELETVQGRVYSGILRLLQIRQQNLAFTRADTEIIDTTNPHVFGYFRHHNDQSVLVLANFSEASQVIPAKRLRTLGLRKTVTDIVNGRIIVAAEQLMLEPYQFVILLASV